MPSGVRFTIGSEALFTMDSGARFAIGGGALFTMGIKILTLAAQDSIPDSLMIVRISMSLIL